MPVLPLLIDLKRVTTLLFIAIGLLSCRKEVFDTSNNLNLTFSKEKIQFDTVFTARGSATLNFKIKNENPGNLKIGKVSLGFGKKSYFRFNLDGQSGPEITTFDLAGGDSAYCFVEVTIDPQNNATPFVVDDSLLFEVNGKVQYVKLQAYGQNVKYFRNVGVSGNLSADSPYVFVDYIQIPIGRTLNIPAGTRIYCHNGTLIDVYGTLKMNGLKDKPVIIQGDRLERIYSKDPDQWQGIIFRKSSNSNTITHSIIQNGSFGIYDSFYTGNQTVPKIVVDKSIIRNMSSYGVLGLNSFIELNNSIIYNCGRVCFIVDKGGEYNITHCTIDNSKSIFVRTETNPTMGIYNYAYQNSTGQQVIGVLNMSIRNSIIYGSEDKEIQLGYEPGSSKIDPSKIFSNCCLKTSEFKIANCLINKDPLYEDANSGNFKIQKNSPCNNYGLGGLLNDDIDDLIRSNTPDIGAHEN